jgi:hypothetical protein
MKTSLVELNSGQPWHLSCTVEQVGRDFLCHIHGGDWHVGAVALAQRDDDRLATGCLVVGIHKEEAIALYAAERLGAVCGTSVVCIAGIHFDGITKSEIAAISHTANSLADEAAGQLMGELRG